MKKMFLIDLAVCAAVLLLVISFSSSKTTQCDQSCTSKKEIKCQGGGSDPEASGSTMPIQWFKY